MKLTWKQYAAIGGDLLAVIVAYVIGKWLGLALAVFFIASVWGYQIMMTIETTRNVLLSRLPDRCAMCHREVLDEPGTTDFDLEGELRIYHDACAEKLDAIKEREKLPAQS
jgi:hypothetical protein